MMTGQSSDVQIVGIFKQAEASLLFNEICRQGGFRDATVYKQRAKFGGMSVSADHRLRELESENALRIGL